MNRSSILLHFVARMDIISHSSGSPGMPATPPPLHPTTSFSDTENVAEFNTAFRSIHFYWDPVVFEVEGVLYKVPRARFIEGSALFATMFMLPPSSEEGKLQDGGSDEKPVVLPHVEHQEFHQLLETLYPPLHPRTRSKVEWVAVLKLATRYEFQAARAHATEQISKLLSEMTPMEKMTLGQRYHVSAWFLEGVSDLVIRRDALSEQDLADIGSSIFARVGKERERCRDLGHRSGNQHSQPCPHSTIHAADLRIVFQPELEAIAWHNAANMELDTVGSIGSNSTPTGKGKKGKGKIGKK